MKGGSGMELASEESYAGSVVLDEKDELILDLLERNGRATLSQMSQATSLSVSAVQSRVQKLERRGIIEGYRAIINHEKRGEAVTAFVSVTPLNYAEESTIPERLKDIPGILSCDSISGAPSFMLTVRVATPGRLESLLNLIHKTVPVSTETTVVLRRYFSK